MASEPILITVLTDVVRSLTGQGADYALAGGLAYGALVEPRATTDVDLLILIDKPTPKKIAALFSSTFESLVPHPSPMEFKGLSIWRTVGIWRGSEIIVDLLLAQSDFLRTALRRKRTVDFRGVPLPIVTLEDLVILKVMAGRLQDLADLERIKQRPELRVDWGYVEEWLGRLGLKPIK